MFPQDTFRCIFYTQFSRDCLKFNYKKNILLQFVVGNGQKFHILTGLLESDFAETGKCTLTPGPSRNGKASIFTSPEPLKSRRPCLSSWKLRLHGQCVCMYVLSS